MFLLDLFLKRVEFTMVNDVYFFKLCFIFLAVLPFFTCLCIDSHEMGRSHLKEVFLFAKIRV